MKLKFFPIFLFFVIAGCFGKTSPPVSAYESSALIPPETSIRDLLKQSDVKCDENSCPDAVGEIVGRDRTAAGMFAGTCTGWLVASDIVVTNSHCIPADVKKNAICGDWLGIKFPAEHGFPEEIYTCTEVLLFSSITTSSYSNADFAFFRISGASHRKPFKIVRSPIPESTTLDIYAVDPISTTELTGRIRHKTCTTREGSVVMANYVYDYADVITGFGRECSIVPGNSGSPAFDQNGNVPAIVFATGKGGLTNSINQRAQQIGIGAMNDELHVGLLTNFACLNIPSGVSVPPSLAACDSAQRAVLQKSGEDAQEVRIQTPLKADQETEDAQLVDAGPKPFQFTVSPHGTVVQPSAAGGPREILTYDVDPTCLNPKSAWETGSFALNGNAMTVRYSVPSFAYGRFLDSFARIEMRRVSRSMMPVTIHVDLSKVSDVSGEVGTQTVGNSSPVPFSTRWCP